MNTYIRAAGCLAVLLTFGCAHGSAPPQAPIVQVDAPDSVRERASAILSASAPDYPGLAFTLIAPDGAVWRGGAGYSDLDGAVAMTAATPLSVYSVSKPMTATLALHLVEIGRLDLDAPIGAADAGLPAPLAALTARELLTHTGGVRHYRDGEWLPNARRTCTDAEQGRAPFADDALGARGAFSYSSFGYVLLSDVLQRASGERFETALTTHVFQRAGMANTSLWQPGLRRPPHGYEEAGRGFRVAREIDNSCKFGGGAVIASAEDVARFAAALRAGALISASSWAAMTADVENNYGLGWGVGALADGAPSASHTGSGIGGTSAIVIDLDRGFVAAVVGNVDGPSLVDEAKALIALAREQVRPPGS